MNDQLPLSSIFSSHNGAAFNSESIPADAPCETWLQSAWEVGQKEWSDLQISAPFYIAHIAERIDKVETYNEIKPHLDALCLGDLYLACGCCFALEKAIRKFDEVYINKVPLFVSHMRLGASFAADLQQELRQKLLTLDSASGQPGIAAYRGRGELGNWLRAIAVRMAISRRRRRDEQVILDEGEAAERLTELAVDPVLLHMRKKYGVEIKAAIEEVIAALSTEQRNLLRFHYIDGLSTPQLAAMLGINQSNVSRRLIAIRDAILLQTQNRIRQKMNISESEFREISKQIYSQMNLSLSRILRQN